MAAPDRTPRARSAKQGRAAERSPLLGAAGSPCLHGPYSLARSLTFTASPAWVALIGRSPASPLAPGFKAKKP